MSLLQEVMDKLSCKGELPWGPRLFSMLWTITTRDVPNACPSLYSGSGGSGHHSLEVVGGITMEGGGHWGDHYVELCVRST